MCSYLAMRADNLVSACALYNSPYPKWRKFVPGAQLFDENPVKLLRTCGEKFLVILHETQRKFGYFHPSQGFASVSKSGTGRAGFGSD